MSVEPSDRPVGLDGSVEGTSDAQAGELPASGESRVSRVLVVVAHPDDETLTAGGLLAALASRCAVTLVTCTRGERGEVIGNDLAHLRDEPAELAGHREGELERALVALGIASHHFLDDVDGGDRLVDSGMRWDDGARHVRALPAADAGPDAFSTVPLERPVRALVSVIDTLRPDLVIVDEPDGGYGHPDHRRAHEVTMAAVEQAEWRTPLVAWPVRPASTVRAAQEWLRTRTDLPTLGEDGQPLRLAEPDADLPSIVVPDEEIAVAVDVTPQLPALVAAMRAHRSQVQAAHLEASSEVTGPAAGWYALSNGLLQPILRGAWLKVAPGWGQPAALRAAVENTLRGEARPVTEGRWFRPTMIGFSVILGVTLGALGTTFHRAWAPWGLVLALVAVIAGGVLARTFVDRAGQLAYAPAVAGAVLVLTYVSPGGDVLVTGEPIGVAWILLSVVAAAVGPALAPRRWFADG